MDRQQNQTRLGDVMVPPELQRTLSALQQHALTPHGASELTAYMRRQPPLNSGIGLGGMLPSPAMRIGSINVGGQPVDVSFDGKQFRFDAPISQGTKDSLNLGGFKGVGSGGIGINYQRSF